MAGSNAPSQGGRRWRATACAVLIGVLAVLALPSPAASQTAEARVERLERELAALRAEIEALRTSPGAQAVEPTPAGAPDLTEVARRLDLLAAEIERLKLGEAAATADVAEKGLGPAASKIYRTGHGLSIGGYGEALYQNFDSERDDGAASGLKDRADFLRGVLYVGYKFDDRWLLNTEVEYEHASTGEGGEVSVEFAYLDYLWRPQANVRAGLVLLPMGFLNELHEPTVYYGARRPDLENRILPSTWRENGFGLWGDVGPITYRTYVVNGLDATGFTAAGLRGGRQKGAQALAADLAWVGRADVTAVPGLLAGGSVYLGDSGQEIAGTDRRPLGVGTRIFEGHVEWKWRGLALRALGARAELSEAAALNRALGLTGNRSVGERQDGYYLEAAYDLWAGGAGGRSLAPYVRWEKVDTQAEVPSGFARDPARDSESLTLGLAIRPIDPLVFKVDYQDYDNGAGTGVDQVNVAFGYIF